MWFRVRWAVAVFSVLTVLFALGSTALVTTAAVDASGARRMESDTILVKFKSSTARCIGGVPPTTGITCAGVRNLPLELPKKA